MKNFLNLLRAFGMSATTIVATPTVVSCGFIIIGWNNDNSNNVEYEKYENELKKFNLLVQETVTEEISNESTSKSGTYYNGDNESKVKGNTFFLEKQWIKIYLIKLSWIYKKKR